MSGSGYICVEPDRKCEMCGKVAECRPYGPKGEQICFPCGQKDKKQTEQKMREHILGEVLQ